MNVVNVYMDVLLHENAKYLKEKSKLFYFFVIEKFIPIEDD